jgi:hypothetical protein
MNPAIPDPTQTTLAPGATAQAVIAPEPTSRWKALRQIGYWKNFDFVVLVTLLLTFVVGACWYVFSAEPQFVHLLGFALVACLQFQAWTISVLYRCMDFVLQVRASQEMLPYDAARVAVGFMQGGQPIQK